MSAPTTRSLPLATAHSAAPRRPEVLSPAGDWDCVRAAVENGADAIYFGLDRFNARMRANNFTAADLPDLMRFLHRRGVRGYVTFNTLVFSDELSDAADYIRTLVSAGVDAVIVQDVGICRMIRALSPDLPIHISTQMTVTSAAGVRFAQELGANLVVLARENSLKEIAALREALGDSPAQLPLEVFVHGALCVAYSGQCLTSESLGGRSANRGECAQACRMPYDLIADGTKVDLGGRRYLLSPRDLAGLDVLPDLVRLGIASLKIEGRLKSAEYVANLTRVYREAVDRIVGKETGSEDRTIVAELWHAHRYDLEMAFSRGLSSGWFQGIDNQQLVHARFGTKRGVFLGKVLRVERDGVVVRLRSTDDPTNETPRTSAHPAPAATAPAPDSEARVVPRVATAAVKAGDGVVFDFGSPEEGEEGGRIYAVVGKGPDVLLTFGHGTVNFARLHPGDWVWKTSDPEHEKRLRASFAGDQPRRLRPVVAEVHGRAGGPLTLLLRDECGRVARAESGVPLAVAEKHPLTVDRLREQLGRLGGTQFQLTSLASNLEDRLMLPMSELNRMRRDAVAILEDLRAAPGRWTLVADGASTAWPRFPEPRSARGATAAPELIVVLRHLRQLDPLLALPGVDAIYCEFENPKHYREAVALFRTHREKHRASGGPQTIWVAPPRIFKPGDEWILAQVRSCNADGYLVRNFDHLAFFADCRRRGDFSLNVANEWSVDYFRRRHGLERLTASYDLNIQQLLALVRQADPAGIEITIHQHMPMFHMEHCVFCAFLSTGTNYTNCGRPCDRVNLRLRDHVGAEHPVKADAGCRNTVFNGRAQSGAEYVARLLEVGVRNFRIDLLDEDPAEIVRLIGRYRQLLAGTITGAEVWREFRLVNQLGVTRGTLPEPGKRPARP